MLHAIRITLFLLTFVGLGMRASDMHSLSHGNFHETCEHHHEHDEPDSKPCGESSHRHCCNLLPVFYAPNHSQPILMDVNGIFSTFQGIHDWRMPEDPVYTPDIPPVIG